MSLDFVVAIPARLGSTRLPEKPLRMLAGRPMIAWVADRARAAGARAVVVATDSPRIADAVAGQGVETCLTRADHLSGTDRLAEVADRMAWPDDLVVVNLQGDEPLAPPRGIRHVADVLVAHPKASVATLAAPLASVAQLFDPNCVKVVRDGSGLALYFTRAPVPWARDAFAAARDRLPDGIPFLRHIGIYAYSAKYLRELARMPASALERAESLEQLRVLESGARIAVGDAPEEFPAGVDTAADVERVSALLQARQASNKRQ
jgi:3-deoxy-manno-octulosonate cytidylyltransferase (CMP-KDO synthetase)